MIYKNDTFVTGEEVFCAYRLGLVEQVEDGKVTFFTEGNHRVTGTSFAGELTCFRNTDQIASISEEFAALERELRAYGGSMLDWRNVSEYLRKTWEAACKELDVSNDAARALVGQARNFVRQVKLALQTQVFEVEIFGHSREALSDPRADGHCGQVSGRRAEEIFNLTRAAGAAAALEAYGARLGTDTSKIPEAVVDLLDGLMHLCVQRKVDFEEALQLAQRYHNIEVQVEEELDSIAGPVGGGCTRRS